MKFDPGEFQILGFNEPVFTVQGDNRYRLTEAYIVTYAYKGVGYRLIVPKGDETDGASVPQAAWSLGIIPVGLQMAAAVMHDELYRYQGALPQGQWQQFSKGEYINLHETWTREQCDQLFLRLLKVAGVATWKRYAMFYAVRACGFVYWNRWFKPKA
jgi:hypothetical protein